MMRRDKGEIEKIFYVSGIDCSFCANEVQKGLSRLDGILSAKVIVDESKVLVKLDRDNTDEREIENIISELGLQIQKERSKKTSVFFVEGLDCSEEERIIRKGLEQIEEIEDLKFDFVNHKLIVTHSTVEGRIFKKLNSLGFKSEIYQNKIHLNSYKQKEKYLQLVLLILSSTLILLGLFTEYLEISPFITFSLFFISIFIGGYRVFYKAIKSLNNFRIDINILMSIAVIGAIIIGEYAEAAIVMLLYTISLRLENFSIEKAKKSISQLISIIPEYSTIRKDDDYLKIRTTEIRVGDLVLIKPGEKIPVDGIVVEGASAVNQSPITGESKLIAKLKGDHCYAGTINQRGTLLLEATSTYRDSHFSRIISLLEETTSTSKSNLQRVVDNFSKYYTPFVVSLAFIIMMYSYFVENEMLVDAIYKGLVLLVISCPCALVISTPIAILASIARATKFGVLIKGGIFIENLHRIDAIAFDKTGTLTEGKFRVDKIILLDNKDQDQLLEIAYNLEIHSEHSIADAIVDYTKNMDLKLLPVENFSVREGAIFGKLNGINYTIGQPALFNMYLNKNQINLINELESNGYTVILILEENIPAGLICLSDILRDNLKDSIDKLHKLGVKEFFILSGDNRNIVKQIAKDLNIKNYFAELKPIDKVNIVKELNKKFKYFTMIGDGLNDAPALKSASIGIAMGRIGTDATIENSDIVLLGDDISKLPMILELSKKTVKTIKENIALSIGIKFLFIILAFVGIASMWGAIFADMGSSFIVIFNSLKLTNTKI